MTTEKRTLHFDLNHLGHLHEDTVFTLHAPGVKKKVLQSYASAPHKLSEHCKTNKALAAMAPQHAKRLTHFVEDVELCATQVTICQVLFPSLDDHPLPEIALRFVNIPKHHVIESLKMRPHYTGQRILPRSLSHYGVAMTAVPAAAHDEVHADSTDVKPPYEEAKTLVFLHPEIGSINPQVAQNVFDNHIETAQSFSDLYTYIANNPAGSGTPYYTKTYATWTNPDTGNVEPAPANTDLKYGDGGSVDWPMVEVNGKSQPCIPQRQLSGFNPDGDNTGVMVPLSTVVSQVLVTTKNDVSLNGQLWTKQNGVTSQGKTSVLPAPLPSQPKPAAVSPRAAAAAAAAVTATAAPPANEFVLKNLTSTYGLDLYDLKWDSAQQILTLPVKNWASRYLGAYVEFMKEDGTVIKKSEITNPRSWVDNMPESLRSMFEPSDQKLYLDLVSAGNVIFGVPVPPLDDTNNLSFMWPQQATSANVLMGGLGVAELFKDWDSAVDVAGVVGTGLICYGVTGLSMAFTVAIANPFLWGLKGDAKFGFYAVVGVLGVSAAVVDVGVEGGEKAAKRILGIIGSMAASLIFSTAVTKILEKAFAEAIAKVVAETVAELSAEEILVAIPIAGEILQVASIASDIAGLLATTIECLASPATYKIEVQRKMNLNVSVGPDPTHGKDGHYVWPAVADHYVIQVSYPKGNGQQGGTTYTLAGPMPPSSEARINVTFEGIPAGGKIDVTGNIYSSDNWLAGRWDSGWLNATPDGNDQQSVSGNIKEVLVPLTPTTSYGQKQIINYSDTKKHYWQATTFSINANLAGDLDKGGKPSPAVSSAFDQFGNPLASNASITVNSLGQVWTLTSAGVSFHIWKKEIPVPNAPSLYELEVQNTTNPAPYYVKPDCSPTGHALCHLQNITINNAEYEVGYAWQASGMNMPVDYGNTPQNTQMYAMQSISTLGQPQEQIIEPSRGFTNPTFIAYNQFGLRSLFVMASTYAAELNASDGKPVPTDIAKQFADFKVPLPQNSVVTVKTAGKDWAIGVTGQTAAYELLSITIVDGNGDKQDVIAVYAYPVPKMTNFYLDSRTYTPTNQLYYLRGVDLSGPFGSSSFNYDTTLAWGAFTSITIEDLAVHPDGYVIGVDYDNGKMLALRLPENAVSQEDAPVATPLSGKGLREGLLNKPKALTITADGRILILEEGNSRIQAFDVKGNAVPCFAVGQPNFALAVSYAASLDAWQAGDAASNAAQMTAMRQQFQQNIVPATAVLFSTTSLSSTKNLDKGVVDDALQALFVQYNYATSTQNNSPPTVTSKFSTTTTTAGALWLVTITDTNSGGGPDQVVTYDVRVVENDWGTKVLAVWSCFSFSVDVKAGGGEWSITDPVNAMTFSATLPPKAKSITVQQLSSCMPLREVSSSSLQYLDLAVESKGYIYALFQSGDQNNPTFGMDIYNPDGSVLLTKPQTGINAAKLTVDQWRSMFTLNYQTILGPGGRTEPSVSWWIPSTPST